MANTLPIGDTIKAAWDKLYGVKSTFWVAVIVSQLILLGLMVITKLGSMILGPLGTLCSIATLLIFMLMQIGIYYMGMQRSANLPVNYKQIFYPFSKTLFIRLIGLILIQSVIMLIPGLLAGIATYIIFTPGYGSIAGLVSAILYVSGLLIGIYLILGMLLAMGNVLTKNMLPIDAIKKSYDCTKSHIFELFVIYVIYAIIYFILSIPFGLGLIWGIPFMYILYGEIYQRLSAK